jgi:serine/threonine-protein kinase HipA
MAVHIGVYAHWEGLVSPFRLGLLHAQHSGAREVFEFELDATAITAAALPDVPLDPRLGRFLGRQHPPQNSETFGVFSDSSPDRWGRLLMLRRLEREQRAGKAPKNARLHESDYLLGVHDAFRAGALRYRLNDTGDFLDNRHGVAAPPFVKLRELEAASLALERDEDNTAPAGNGWLRMLIAPGGSLGGARPKATVVDPQGQPWIAKFPSARDEHDVGAWELVLQTLAHSAGLRVPESRARRFGSPFHSFLVKRFDRTEAGNRLHFASAMTLTGRHDGDDHSTGASYLELARVVIDHGAQTQPDLHELWSRIAFNMLVSNSDDHLRNHGFILVPNKGWRLSEAYDMNPVADASGLKLNVSEVDNALDLELARSVAPYFRVSVRRSQQIIREQQRIVQQWPKIAASLRIRTREQERMAPAFQLAGPG